jgi:hypothetical protein
MNQKEAIALPLTLAIGKGEKATMAFARQCKEKGVEVRPAEGNEGN